MKKLFFLLFASCCMSASVAFAGVSMQRSGVQHMLIRVDGTERYLLLPIEEAAPEYRMQVIENGRVVRTEVLRLAAQGKVDYYVPFDLSEFNRSELVLSVHVWNQPAGLHTSGSTPMEYIAWNEIKPSDTFDTTNREAYRPLYHHTPEYGWMNDPNGMFYRDGVWHLYYQYNPYCSLWQNMTWAHSTSRDLIHWQHEPVAIRANALGTIFSGSAAVDEHNTAGFGEGAVLAMYTLAELTGQSQALAYSLDGGQTFHQYAGNPILTADVPDFRDPNFFFNETTGTWNLVLAVGQEVRFYSSQDMKNWKYESSFGTGYGCHEGVWECPDLMQIDGKWVLLLNINPGGPNGGSATQYFVGNWDGHTFTCEHTDARWLDYGKDHYATVSFWGAPNGRHTVIGWMSNWQYADKVPTHQYRSANTIARDLFLYTANKQTYVGSRPSPEYDNAGLDRSLKIRKSCTITLSNDEGEELVIRYDEKAMTLSVDRSRSGEVNFSPEFASAPAHAPVYKKIRSMRLFIDNSSVELFANDGEVVMTTLVFPKSKYNKVTVK